MNARGIFLPKYRKGVWNFIEFTWHKADYASRIKCPCKRCVNMVYHHITLIEDHLARYGMDKKYTRWIWHGEGDPNEVVHDDTEDDSDAAKLAEHDGIRELLDDSYQDICSNVCISTSVFEDNSDHEHNIRLR